MGWQNIGRGTRWEGDEAEPLVLLTLNARPTSIPTPPTTTIQTAMPPDIPASKLLERIAAPELVMRPAQPLVWRECGGWADDIYWPE
jgi:hypothetical protein